MYPVRELITLPGCRRARVRHAPIADVPLHSSETTRCAITGLMRRSRVPPFDTLWALESYSGNPAFRSPSINSFTCDCLTRPILADIVKAGSP